MTLPIRSLCAAAALAVLVPAASATVLNFDDIGVDGAVPLHYGGLDWSAGGWSVFGEPQDPYTPHSGAYRAATGFGATDAETRIRFAAPTVFEGAWFSGLGGAVLSFQLYSGSTLVGTSAALDPGATPAFLASGHAGLIDSVLVSSADPASFAMDDFTFSQPVPEPGNGSLVLAGIGAVALLVRRRARG